MKTALILYPHQLFKIEHLPEVDTVIMVEEPLFFGVDHEFQLRLHKQKLILHRASMRRYVEEVLWPADYKVDYVDLDVFMDSGDILDRTKKFDTVYLFDTVEDILMKRILQARREREDIATIEFLPSPNFYLEDHEARDYFSKKHTHLFGDFYQWQRERFNVLIDADYKPVGGAWRLKDDKSKPLPEGNVPPTFEVFGGNQYVDEAVSYVNEHFPNNPGSTDFIWPTNHHEAEKWLEDFVDNRLDSFGAYQDTIDTSAAWMYHSALSSSLNIGLLSPHQVVEAALGKHRKSPVALHSLEVFIRQILGRREFVRGQYIVKHNETRRYNPFRHNRRFTGEWYTGNLGLPPFDDMVSKLHQHAYAHNSERAFVAGGLMLLCEIHPDDVFKWFGELFIDAYDWAMAPNIYNLSRFIEREDTVSNPPICPSDDIIGISNYQKGDWADVWDGLYWRFIEKHHSKFSALPQMKKAVEQLSKMDPDRRRIIGYRAEDFLNQFTQQ